MGKEKKAARVSCASCNLEVARKSCYSDRGTGPKGCPTLTRKEVLVAANKEYEVAEILEFARQASIQESECYANRHERPYIMQPCKTRIVEVCEFARKMGYTRLGLAFCMGLAKEAAVVDTILKENGFEVISILCKAGRTLKEKIGVRDAEKIHQGTDESMCNPIYQAKLLNYERTEFNIVLGLCVGHDALFFKYAEALTTVLAVKDRVTGHNPLAAIYLSDTYYRRLHHAEAKADADGNQSKF